MSIAKIAGAVVTVATIVGAGVYYKLGGKKSSTDNDNHDAEKSKGDLDDLNKQLAEVEASIETLRRAHFRTAKGKFTEESEEAARKIDLLLAEQQRILKKIIALVPTPEPEKKEEAA